MDFIENNPLDADILFKESIAIEGGFPSFDLENIDFSALLLQTGYLTVKSQNIIVGELPSYDLAIPNREVHVSLFTSIIKKISRGKPNQINTLEKKISQAIATLDNKLLQEALDTLIATIPSVIYGKIKKEIREANYHILFLAMLNLIGFFAIGEVSHSKRTLDVVIKKNNLVIVCELKYSLNTPLNDLTSEAMNQIKDYEYYKPYLNYDVILLAVAFGDRKVKSQLEPLKKKKNS